MTLIEMLKRNFNVCPSKPAVIYEGEILTYSELHKAVGRLSHHFIRSGIEKGDRVAVMMDKKKPELVISFLSIAACGGIAVPVDCNQTSSFIEQLFDIITPAGIVVAGRMHHRLEKCEFSFPAQRMVTCNGDERGSQKILMTEVISDDSLPDSMPEGVVDEDDAFYFNLTSGTTGFPKCAVTTHANIYWNTLSAVELLALTADDNHLCMFPPSTHPHEFFSRALLLGGTMVLTDQIAPKSLTKVIENHQVTAMMAIAPIYANFVKCHKNNNFKFSSLRKIESGGMHLDPITARAFRRRFGMSIIPVWGSTETAGIALGMPLKAEGREGSCGIPNNYYEAKIVDSQGNDVSVGKVGQMVVKGPGVCSSYYKNDEATRKNYKGEWYYTGDMFRQDEDGYYYFSGRRQGMMKVAGMKVYPVEIEDLLIQHPLIREVAVTKFSDPLHGEIPKAIIVPEEGSALTKKDIRTYCTKKLASYKIPKVIEYRESLPKNPTGKILVNML